MSKTPKVDLWCPKCGAEITHDPEKATPLRMFRPPNACERFPHRWEKVKREEPAS